MADKWQHVQLQTKRASNLHYWRTGEWLWTNRCMAWVCHMDRCPEWLCCWDFIRYVHNWSYNPFLMTTRQREWHMPYHSYILQNFRRENSDHPPYSPDLAVSDFHLVPAPKEHHAVHRCQSDEDAETVSDTVVLCPGSQNLRHGYQNTCPTLRRMPQSSWRICKKNKVSNTEHGAMSK